MDEHKTEKHHHHHILPNKVALTVGVCLFIFTAITVWVAHVDLGPLNFLVAMFVATIKASLVALFFMGLRYDKLLNGLTFATSFLFLAIFIVLTSTDLFFRGDVYVKGPLVPVVAAKSRFKQAWIATPELIAHGKSEFAKNCASCHGDAGRGDGPAAAALNPKPRNFTSGEGWKIGRKPSQVFNSVTKGIPGTGMSSFQSLPADTRWAISHYVLTLGPEAPKDTPQDLAKVGVDPSKGEAEEKEAPTIPVELAMKRMAQPEEPVARQALRGMLVQDHPGAHVYKNRCAECHGARGEGGIQVLGVSPKAYVVTRPLNPQTADEMRSYEAFSQRVIRGIQGNLMPSNGHLSSSEMRDLYDYVKSVASSGQ